MHIFKKYLDYCLFFIDLQASYIYTLFRQHNKFNHEAPITAAFTLQLIQDIQRSDDRTLIIDLIERTNDDHRSNLSTHRAMFDQVSIMKQYPSTRAVISSLSAESMTATHEHIFSHPLKLP